MKGEAELGRALEGRGRGKIDFEGAGEGVAGKVLEEAEDAEFKGAGIGPGLIGCEGPRELAGADLAGAGKR